MSRLSSKLLDGLDESWHDSVMKFDFDHGYLYPLAINLILSLITIGSTPYSSSGRSRVNSHFQLPSWCSCIRCTTMAQLCCPPVEVASVSKWISGKLGHVTRLSGPFVNSQRSSLTPFLGGFHTHFFQGTFVWQYNLASSSTPTTSAFFSVFRVILNSSNSDSGLLEQQSTCRRPCDARMNIVATAASRLLELLDQVTIRRFRECEDVGFILCET